MRSIEMHRYANRLVFAAMFVVSAGGAFVGCVPVQRAGGPNYVETDAWLDPAITVPPGSVFDRPSTPTTPVDDETKTQIPAPDASSYYEIAELVDSEGSTIALQVLAPGQRPSTMNARTTAQALLFAAPRLYDAEMNGVSLLALIDDLPELDALEGAIRRHQQQGDSPFRESASDVEQAMTGAYGALLEAITSSATTTLKTNALRSRTFDYDTLPIGDVYLEYSLALDTIVLYNNHLRWIVVRFPESSTDFPLLIPSAKLSLLGLVNLDTREEFEYPLLIPSGFDGYLRFAASGFFESTPGVSADPDVQLSRAATFVFDLLLRSILPFFVPSSEGQQLECILDPVIQDHAGSILLGLLADGSIVPYLLEDNPRVPEAAFEVLEYMFDPTGDVLYQDTLPLIYALGKCTIDDLAATSAEKVVMLDNLARKTNLGASASGALDKIGAATSAINAALVTIERLNAPSIIGRFHIADIQGPSNGNANQNDNTNDGNTNANQNTNNNENGNTNENDNACFSCSSPTIGAVLDATITAGEYYSLEMLLVQGTCVDSWSLDTAPPGMQINPGSGAVTWPEPYEGTYEVVIMVESACGSDEEAWTLTIECAGADLLGPSQPTVSGPSSGLVGEEQCFAANGGAICSDDPIEIQFDWDNGDESEWGNATQCYTYENSGEFGIRARTRSELNPALVSDWSAEHDFDSVDPLCESASTPTVTGPTSGQVGVTYTFCASSTSGPVGLALEYQFSILCDGCDTWLEDPWQEPACLEISFGDPGTWTLRARARCANEPVTESGWSSEFQITIPCTETISTPSVSGPSSGNANVPYAFTAVGASSSEGHPLEYQFRYQHESDGWQENAWGTPSTLNKSFSYDGTWYVGVRARCEYHHTCESGWSTDHAIGIATPPPLCDDPLILQCTADTQVSDGQPSKNYGDYDDIDTAFANGCDSTRYLLVNFDVPPEIAGKNIVEATLTMYATSYGWCGADGDLTVQSFRINGSWTESGVTWNSQPSTTGSATDSVLFSPGETGFEYWDVTDIVQAWADGSPMNGIMLKAIDPGINDRYRGYESKEISTKTTLEIVCD